VQTKIKSSGARIAYMAGFCKGYENTEWFELPAEPVPMQDAPPQIFYQLFNVVIPVEASFDGSEDAIRHFHWCGKHDAEQLKQRYVKFAALPTLTEIFHEKEKGDLYGN
jgi:hypothetical protein